MREGTAAAKRHDLSSLRHLASVGEPLNPEAVHWSREAFGLPFHDTYWQTETGCIVISNYPGMPVQAGLDGEALPGHHGGRPRPGDARAAHGAGACRGDRPPPRLALDDPRLLEQPRRLREEVHERLVPHRRPRHRGRRRLLLVRGTGRRRDQHGRAPRRSVRGRVGAPRAPRRRRVGRRRQARPREHGSRQGVRRAQAGLHAGPGPRARDHELRPETALSHRDAAGDRLRGVAPAEPERQDRPPGPSRGRSGASRSATFRP